MDAEKLEKVMKGLEACSDGMICGKHCPYEDVRDSDGPEDNCIATLARDALKLIEDLESGRILSAPTEEPARMLTFNEAMNNASNYRDMTDSVRPVFVQFRAEEYRDGSHARPYRTQGAADAHLGPRLGGKALPGRR